MPRFAAMRRCGEAGARVPSDRLLKSGHATANAPQPAGEKVESARLGNTGLKVSRLALGCMSYGDPTTPGAHEWSLKEDEAQPYFRQAVELGITFWDTANVYQAGTSEELVGRAIKRYSRREDV